MTALENLLTSAPFLVAHRCGGGHWPEFSLRGIAGSTALGVRALEISVHPALTGEWVCSHDPSTTRATGVDLDIAATPWTTLRQLLTRPDPTDDPHQSPTPLIELTNVLEATTADQVLFLDHKPTSMGAEDPARLSHEARLFDFLDEHPGLRERIVWKVFAPAEGSRRRAAERGYPTWGIHYAASMNLHVSRAGRFDLLGLNWDAPRSAWERLTALGAPVIGHIITKRPHGEVALLQGASGLMCTVPGQFAT